MLIRGLGTSELKSAGIIATLSTGSDGAQGLIDQNDESLFSRSNHFISLAWLSLVLERINWQMLDNLPIS
jgi:hypothetical protein